MEISSPLSVSLYRDTEQNFIYFKSKRNSCLYGIMNDKPKVKGSTSAIFFLLISI